MPLAALPRLEPLSPSLEQLLDLAGVRSDQTISVAGPDSLEIMIALCRAGFQRVECARQSTCAGADETSHLLILTGPPESLGGLAARTLPLLRDGGFVAAWLVGSQDDAPIRAALLVRGMELITSASVQADGLIIAHRVRRKGRLALVW